VNDASNPALPEQFRSVCYRCFKPSSTCVCESIQPVNNRTGITIVQHPRERHHPIGTARFLQLGLSHVRLLEDTAGRLREEQDVAMPPGTGVLYPSPDAIDLATLPREQQPSHLVVIDGTWHQAKTLYRDIPWLKQLPHYRFTPKAESRYRIRREPRVDYVSTLEATLAALSFIEPELGDFEGLLTAFDRMIDVQIARAATRTQKRVRVRRRAREYLGLPRAIFENYDKLVVVYAEAASRQFFDAELPPSSPAPRFALDDPHRKESELLYFAAHRVSTGETFEALVAPSVGALNERHLAHMQLSEQERARLLPAPSFSEFQQRFAEFQRRGDVYAAWNQSALRWLDTPTTSKGDHILLKAAYGGLGRAGGALEVIAQVEGFAPVPVACSGRARERMGNALGLLGFLRAVTASAD
jgi:DTW domain-containing protein